MIPFTLDTHKFNLPQSWDEITFKAFMKFRTSGDDICAILEALTGIDKEVWYNTRNIDFVDKLLPYLTWLSENNSVDYFKSLPVPKQITIEGKLYPVPKDIAIETYGQRLTFESLIQRYVINDDVNIEFSPIAIGIYLCEKPFNDTRAVEIADKIEQLPVTQVVPLASFFLSSFLQSLVKRKPLLRETGTRPKRYRRE